MNEVTRLSVLLVAVFGCLGCGSSETAQPGPSMNEMASRMAEREEATGNATVQKDAGAADRGAQPTVGGSRSGSSAATASPAASDPNVKTKRGFALDDWSNEAAYVMVKSDADQVAEQLAQQWQGEVREDVFGKPIDVETNGTIVYQLAGHPWSIFACDNRQLETLLPALSQELAADTLVFWHSDFNGWAAVELYRGGEQIEAVHWGGVDEKLGEDADASRWDSEGQIRRDYDGFTSMDSYFFRSKLRKVAAEELQKGDEFVDWLMREHDAYLPKLDEMPWVDFDSNAVESPLGAAAFSGVYFVAISPQ